MEDLNAEDVSLGGQVEEIAIPVAGGRQAQLLRTFQKWRNSPGLVLGWDIISNPGDFRVDLRVESKSIEIHKIFLNGCDGVHGCDLTSVSPPSPAIVETPLTELKRVLIKKLEKILAS